MKIVKIISAILVVAGMVMIAFARHNYRVQVRFMDDAIAATGEVTAQTRQSSSGLRGRTSTWYTFRVRFRTATGEVVEGEAMATSTSPRFAEGQQVPVLYFRSAPQEFNIDDFAMLWADAVVLGTIGVSFLGAGLTAFWTAGGNPRRKGRTEASLPELIRAWREGRLTRNSEFQPLLIAFAFVGFPLAGGTILFVLFAPGVVQIAVATILVWIAFSVARGRRGNG